ncbi:MAG: response regulator transcription factor [Anaerolineae bacterium]
MTIKILIVDDEPHIVRLVSFKLKKAGFDVVAADHGQQAIDLALSERPAVVLLDVMLPDIDGYTVCGQLKEQLGADAPAIALLTARSQQSDVLQGYECGADSYITKPFDPDDLLTTVQQLLQN